MNIKLSFAKNNTANFDYALTLKKKLGHELFTICLMTVCYVPRCYLHSSDNMKNILIFFFLGLGLISISPCFSNNIRTKNEQKKKIILEFCPMNMHLHLFMEIQERFA